MATQCRRGGTERRPGIITARCWRDQAGRAADLFGDDHDVCIRRLSSGSAIGAAASSARLELCSWLICGKRIRGTPSEVLPSMGWRAIVIAQQSPCAWLWRRWWPEAIDVPSEPPPRGCLQHVRTVRALAAGGRRREWRRWLRRDGPRSRNVKNQGADQIAPGHPRVIRPPAGDRRSGACACVCLARALGDSHARGWGCCSVVSSHTTHARAQARPMATQVSRAVSE